MQSSWKRCGPQCNQLLKLCTLTKLRMLTCVAACLLHFLHSSIHQGVVSCLELEAGYILLSSLAASLPAEQLLEGVGGAEGLLRLLEPALGLEAATELDRRYCSNVVRGNCRSAVAAAVELRK